MAATSAFVSPTAFASTRQQTGAATDMRPAVADFQPAALQRQRKSMANVQTMGLFGLGPAEIAIILVAGAFVLGPEKLAELGKDAGKVAGELKEVPKEFQKGLAEGEASAKAMKKEVDAEVVEEDSSAE